jgi:hypothetical protein
VGLVVIVAIIGAISGGGSGSHSTSTVASSTPSSTETSAPTAPSEHITPAPKAPTYCDRNVHVGRATTCAFAENVFRAYAQAIHASGGIGKRVQAKSAATGLTYSMICHGHGGTESTVACTGGKGAVVEFPYLAAHAYSTPSAVPAAPEEAESQPESEPEPETGSEGSGGGTDEVGSFSHEGDEQFCNEHECIGRFTEEPGTVVECSDGSFSHSGGISGACSDHGGEAEG